MFDARKVIQMALDGAAAAKAKGADEGEFREGTVENPDGTVTIRRLLRLDPKAVAELGRSASKPVAKARPGVEPPSVENAQDAAVEAAACDSKGHDTPLENCKAKNPMFCPYHGCAAIKANLFELLKQKGIPGEDFHDIDVSKRLSGAIAIAVTAPKASAKVIEKVLDAFLGQPGFKKVGGGEMFKKGPFSKMTAIAKQDTLMKPSDEEMLDEWTDALFEDEDLLGTEQFGDLLSMQAEIDALNEKDELSDEEKEYKDKLVKQAQESYHQMKAGMDYKHVSSAEEAKGIGADLVKKFDEKYEVANHYGDVLKERKKETWGSTMNPVGFPGNTEVSNAGGKILKFDGDSMTAAKALLEKAAEDGDLEGMKLALHNMEDAIESADRHLKAYGAQVTAMLDNLDKCKELGIGPKDAKGKTKAEKMAWFESMGITHPEELKKMVGESVAKKSGKASEKKSESAKNVAEEVVKKASEVKAAKDVVAAGDLPDEMLKPLAHDESAFPANLTQAALDAAIKKGKALGGASGDHATLVEINGKKYVAKAGTGSHAEHIRNEIMADQAYRAGGVLAPDCKGYEFGGKQYKLAEYIEGKRLDKFMSDAGEADKAAVRRELLKGFPLDVLFSNWDVIGTSRDNVIVDGDGRAWRIDNGGSFGMAATSNKKDMSYAKSNYEGKCAFEDWDEKGGWEKREWIDDFRTMRVDPKNKGLFDGYSTADIFLSAGNINMKAAVASLPQGTQAALKKPLFEMNQMAQRAVSMGWLGGYKNNEMISTALDASYEASKDGIRERCVAAVHYNDGGFGSLQTNAYSKAPFEKPEPEAPVDPMAKFTDPEKNLPNSEYTGGKIASMLITAAKSINYHCGKSMHEGGSKMDTPDFTPNPSAMAQLEKIDKEKLAHLAKTDSNAQTMLDVLNAIAQSKANGYKTEIGMVPQSVIAAKLPADFKTKAEKAFEKDKAGAMQKYKADKAAYEAAHEKWAKEKSAWDEAEEKKAAASGKSAWKTFHDYASKLISQNRDSYGKKGKTSGGVSALESQAKAQKGSSSSAGRLKLWEMAMMGMTLDEMENVGEDHPTIHIATHASGIKNAIDFYKSSPKDWEKDVRSYAAYKGLNLLKMENESNSLYDHASKTVCVFRGLHGQVKTKKGETKSIVKGENDIHQEGTADCCMFEKNNWTEDGQQAYIVPMSRVCFNFYNKDTNGNHIGSYASEQEIIVNLTDMIPYGVSQGDYGSAHKAALTGKGIKKAMDGWAKRIKPFASHIKEIAAK